LVSLILQKIMNSLEYMILGGEEGVVLAKGNYSSMFGTNNNSKRLKLVKIWAMSFSAYSG